MLADLDAAAMVAARKEKPSRLAMREDGEILPCQSRRQIGIGDALPFALDDGQGVERRSGEPRAVMFIRGLEAAFFAGAMKLKVKGFGWSGMRSDKGPVAP